MSEKMDEKPFCSSPGCGNPLQWSGLCKEHYWKMMYEASEERLEKLEVQIEWLANTLNKMIK